MNTHIQDGIVYQQCATGLKVLGFADKDDTRADLAIPEYIKMQLGGRQYVVEIADGAFANSAYIQFVKIPKSVTEIGDSAFKSCDSLRVIRTYPIESNYRNIILHREAFCDCKNLRDVILCRPVVTEADVFNGCTFLEMCDMIFTYVANGTFEGCKFLEPLSFAKGARLRTNSVEKSGVTKIRFAGDVEYISPQVLEWLRKAIVEVYCTPDSNVAEFAYDGINVKFY